MLFCSGRWNESYEDCDRFLREVEAGSPHYMEAAVRLARARIRVACDDVAGALADAEIGLERARAAREPQLLHGVQIDAARVLLEAGQEMSAESIVLGLVRIHLPPSYVVTLAIALTALGHSADARTAVRKAPLKTRWVDAARAYLEGDFVRAAEVLAEIGHLPDEAYVRFRAAERFLAEGQRTRADDQFERALAFWRSVGATRYIRRAEAALAATG